MRKTVLRKMGDMSDMTIWLESKRQYSSIHVNYVLPRMGYITKDGFCGPTLRLKFKKVS